MTRRAPLYGWLAEFETPEALLAAVRSARGAGYRRMDAYTPFPIEHLAEELGFHHTRLPLLVLIGGLLGCAAGFLMQYYASVIDYPLNIGRRPLNSWPAFVPITFECTILAAALTTVLGMLALNGLPKPHHPLFNHPRFALASRNRFFLCIEATDRKFNREATEKFLAGLRPTGLNLVQDA